MNKRQAKKAKKKVTYPFMDEMNLLTLSAEEYKAAIEDLDSYVHKYCQYKHYKDKYKNFDIHCYHLPIGKKYAESFAQLIQQHSRGHVSTTVTQKLSNFNYPYPDALNMQDEKHMPTMDDFLKALENRNESEIANQLRQSMITCRLLNPLSNIPLPIEMKEILEVYRKPTISQCIVYDAIEDIPNNPTN